MTSHDLEACVLVGGVVGSLNKVMIHRGYRYPTYDRTSFSTRELQCRTLCPAEEDQLRRSLICGHDRGQSF